MFIVIKTDSLIQHLPQIRQKCGCIEINVCGSLGVFTFSSFLGCSAVVVEHLYFYYFCSKRYKKPTTTVEQLKSEEKAYVSHYQHYQNEMHNYIVKIYNLKLYSAKRRWGAASIAR